MRNQHVLYGAKKKKKKKTGTRDQKRRERGLNFSFVSFFFSFFLFFDAIDFGRIMRLRTRPHAAHGSAPAVSVDLSIRSTGL